MNRRDSIAALAALSASAASFGARAQQPRRIVLITPFRPSLQMSSAGPLVDAFRTGLRDDGLVEGRDYALDIRVLPDTRDERDALARAIIAGRPAVIVAPSGFAVAPIFSAGTTLPVVFAHSGDPIEAGLVDSFGRPGRNYTGMTWLSLELVGKRLEMLKDMRPGLKRVALIANPSHPGQMQEKGASDRAASALGLELRYHQAGSVDELERAFAVIRGERCDAVDVYPDGFALTVRDRIAGFANRERLMSISGWAEFAEAGFLASYGVNRAESLHRLASYVARILRGAAPADLPVERPKTIESVINLKTARTLGIRVPPAVLARADRVIG